MLGKNTRLPIPTSHTDITDGEKLTLGDTIISPPGHTPGGGL